MILVKNTLAVVAATLTASNLHADQRLDISWAEIAEESCAPEWGLVKRDQPNLWSEHNSKDLDPNLSESEARVFIKFALAALSVAESTEMLFSLIDEARRDEVSQIGPRLDLTLCLLPSPEERESIAVLGKKTAPSSITSPEMRSKLFSFFDEFKCMGIIEATRAATKLDPHQSDFSERLTDIITSNVAPCE